MASLIEGVVRDGQIRVPEDVTLPENTKVYIFVSDEVVSPDEIVIDLPPLKPVSRIYSPRLANREDAAFFKLEMRPVEPDADL